MADKTNPWAATEYITINGTKLVYEVNKAVDGTDELVVLLPAGRRRALYTIDRSKNVVKMPAVIRRSSFA